ncbi:MAG: hypothetical protein E7594_00325 [Ruminococcaceae bacterium]|nr:hypothetical protein [Oscillospiraceae bacterium]
MTIKDIFKKKDQERPAIGQEEIAKAARILRDWRAAKRPLDSRIQSDETYWQGRYGSGAPANVRDLGCSAWLFNSIANRHADMMDNLPTCICLPREPGDEPEASLLSQIIPVILDRCGFDAVYSDNLWYKLKHGVSAYGVFWNNDMENGFGDIDVCRVDVQNLYWEPGVRSIQDSKHLFLLAEMDTEQLEQTYPAFFERNTRAADPDGLFFDSRDGKTLVVDWYYKKRVGNTDVLHYCKFADGVVLYASENDEHYKDRGWYDHGMYPIVLDVMYPEEGTCYGFGMIAVAKQPQIYIDRLDANFMEYADWASKVRFWAKKSLGVNQEDFMDLDRRIVEVEGDIEEEKLQQIRIGTFDQGLLTLKKLKIDELKETTGNRDVSQGSLSGGITAATAIKALQEAGNKNARDVIAASNRAYVGIVQLIIELIRQFYDRERTFRITREGINEYVSYANGGIAEKEVHSENGARYHKKPVFDIKVKARVANPLSQQAANEFAMQLYEKGAFSPEQREQTLIMLEMMDFDGIGKIRQMVKEGGGAV